MELSIEEDKGNIDDLKAMRVKEVQSIQAQLDQFFDYEAQARQDTEKNLTDVINEKVRKLNEMVMQESDIKNIEVNELSSAISNDVPSLQDQVEQLTSTSLQQHEAFTN